VSSSYNRTSADKSACVKKKPEQQARAAPSARDQRDDSVWEGSWAVPPSFSVYGEHHPLERAGFAMQGKKVINAPPHRYPLRGPAKIRAWLLRPGHDREKDKRASKYPEVRTSGESVFSYATREKKKRTPAWSSGHGSQRGKHPRPHSQKTYNGAPNARSLGFVTGMACGPDTWGMAKSLPAAPCEAGTTEARATTSSACTRTSAREKAIVIEPGDVQTSQGNHEWFDSGRASPWRSRLSIRAHLPRVDARSPR